MKKFYINEQNYISYNTENVLMTESSLEYWYLNSINLNRVKGLSKNRERKNLNLFYLLFVNKVMKQL